MSDGTPLTVDKILYLCALNTKYTHFSVHEKNYVRPHGQREYQIE